MTSSRSRLDRIFGTPDADHSSPFYVEIWATGDPAPVDYLSGQLLAGIRTHRGRATATEETTPGTFSASVVGDANVTTPPLAPGRGVRLILDGGVMDRVLGPAGLPSLDTRNRIRWTGQLADLGDVEIRAGQSAPVLPISGSTILARLGNTDLARTPWPAGTADKTILQDSLVDVWANDPGVQMFDWAIDSSVWTARIAARTAALDQFVSWDVDSVPATQVITDLVNSTGGVLLDLADGIPDWVVPANRRVSFHCALSPDAIVSPFVAGQRMADVLNRATVTWGPSTGTAQVTLEDGWSTQALGVMRGGVTTRLSTAAGAQARAAGLIGRYAWPKWTARTVTIDILGLIERNGPGDIQTVYDVLTIDLGALVSIQGLPDASPVPDGAFWVEGLDEAIDRNNWTITLSLVGYEYLAADVQYADHDAAITWDSIPADVNWWRMTTWYPDGATPTAYPLTSWNATQSGLHWREVGVYAIPGVSYLPGTRPPDVVHTWNDWDGKK